MIFDMHCHTAEGSIDASVSVLETIEKLKNLGYHGMLISDHDSYEGYNSLKENIKDFVVLKGIEYDSVDGGHLLIVLPSDVKNNVFEYRGLATHEVIKLVHKLGGIVGPAHPYGCSKLGIGHTKNKNNYNLLKQFDFIETFNSSIDIKDNLRAIHLALALNKPCFGGSDSHKITKVGKAKTYIPSEIKSEDDLISVVQKGNFFSLKSYGAYYERKLKKLFFISYKLCCYAYGIINRCICMNQKKITYCAMMMCSLNFN